MGGGGHPVPRVRVAQGKRVHPELIGESPLDTRKLALDQLEQSRLHGESNRHDDRNAAIDRDDLGRCQPEEPGQELVERLLEQRVSVRDRRQTLNKPF